MAAIYGHRWTSSFGLSAEDDDGKLTMTGDTWSRGLAGIAEPLIGAGLDACIHSSDEWPPTLPAFRAKCLDIPSSAVVLRCLRKCDERSRFHDDAFLAEVYRRVDWYRANDASYDKRDRLILEAYETVREDVMAGWQLPPPPALLPPPEKPVVVELTPEQAAAARLAREEAIAKLKALYAQPGDEAAA